MEIQKTYITQQKTDISLQFYFFLKYIIKLKPTDTQCQMMLENIFLFKDNNIYYLKISIENIFSNRKQSILNTKTENIREILLKCNTWFDINLLLLCLKFYQVKDLILREIAFSETITLEKLYTLTHYR